MQRKSPPSTWKEAICAVGACGAGGAVGSECVRYSHKPASSLSSTASGPPPSTWKEAWGSAFSWGLAHDRRQWVMHHKALFL